MKSVEVNGEPWSDFDKDREVVRLTGMTGKIVVRATY